MGVCQGPWPAREKIETSGTCCRMTWNVNAWVHACMKLRSKRQHCLCHQRHPQVLHVQLQNRPTDQKDALKQRLLQNLSWQIIQNLNDFAFQASSKIFTSPGQLHRRLNNNRFPCKQTIHIHSKRMWLSIGKVNALTLS